MKRCETWSVNGCGIAFDATNNELLELACVCLFVCLVGSLFGLGKDKEKVVKRARGRTNKRGRTKKQTFSFSLSLSFCLVLYFSAINISDSNYMIRVINYMHPII
jgi:hypothetical protein